MEPLAQPLPIFRRRFGREEFFDEDQRFASYVFGSEILVTPSLDLFIHDVADLQTLRVGNDILLDAVEMDARYGGRQGFRCLLCRQRKVVRKEIGPNVGFDKTGAALALLFLGWSGNAAEELPSGNRHVRKIAQAIILGSRKPQMSNAQTFVDQLQAHVAEKLKSLDLLKDDESGPGDRSEVIRRLKVALKNELEAAELAAYWIPSTPEVDVKLALARQAGDEARHYHLIEKHLESMGASLAEFNPTAEGYGPMYTLLRGFDSTVERVAGAHFTREALALKKNEQFIEFCERAGEVETAELYKKHIQPDEGWHVDIGHRFLARYAESGEAQEKARRAVEAVLELAVKVQRKQFGEMKLSHAPGC